MEKRSYLLPITARGYPEDKGEKISLSVQGDLNALACLADISDKCTIYIWFQPPYVAIQTYILASQ